MERCSWLRRKFALRYVPRLFIGMLTGFICMGVIEIPKVHLSQTHKIMTLLIVPGIVLFEYFYSSYKKKKSPCSFSEGTGWMPTGLLISSLSAAVLQLESGTIYMFWIIVSVICLAVQLSAEQ